MATTTNTDVNYQGGPFGGKGGRTGDRSSRGADEEEGRDSDRDKGNRADMDASKRGRAVARLQALPNGEYPIRNAGELRAAVKEWQTGLKTDRYSGYEVQRHIIRRARDMRMVALLPTEWGVNLEIMRDAIRKRKNSGTIVSTSEKSVETLMAENFESFLVAEGNSVPYPVIIQEATPENNQTMKVKVPFYVGGSMNTPPGFTKKVLFPTGILQETVQEGKKDIAANLQPLTVYARHAQAADASYLPIGAVSDLVAEGSIGYATLEVEPTTVGKDVQVLLRGKKLNAVSLRAGKGRFEMEDVSVNGERMLRMKSLRISGIDFAPDNPAMKTYGIEILQENAEIVPIKKEEKSNKLPDNLTLEELRSKHSELVSEIEKPLVERLDEEIKKGEQLKNKNIELEAKNAKADLAEYAREIAAKHPKKEEALPILMEVADKCKTREEFAAKVFPILMEALSNTTTTVQPKETAEDKLKKLFNAGSGGNGQTRETTGEITQEEEMAGEHVGPLEVPV